MHIEVRSDFRTLAAADGEPIMAGNMYRSSASMPSTTPLPTADGSSDGALLDRNTVMFKSLVRPA